MLSICGNPLFKSAFCPCLEALMNGKQFATIGMLTGLVFLLQAPASAVALPPVVDNKAYAASSISEILNMQFTATNNPDSWSLLGPTYVPGFGALPGQLGMLIPPQWSPATQLLVWDTAGSSGGTYEWTGVASNSDGSDSGTVTAQVFGAAWYGGGVPEFNHLKFTVQPPTNGGMVAGKITATENPDVWSQLLYPSYKTQQYGPVSTPSGIQTPTWDAGTQQFSWNMEGATAGIYTWYVKARGYSGFSAGKIEVTILVPEPSMVLLTLLALLGAASMIRQRQR
jgi:hypothetical protein